MVDITETFHAPDRQEWRRWLDANHESRLEIWLLFYKKHSGVPTVTYDEAVEEALCFGWIDSIMKRVDDEKYAQKFTPRKSTAKWSDLNKQRVARLFREGKMTPAGLAKLNFDPAEVSEAPQEPKREPDVPAFFLEALAASPQALENFMNMPPSQKRYYSNWLSDAKREETRQKRIQQAIEMLLQNKKLGI